MQTLIPHPSSLIPFSSSLIPYSRFLAAIIVLTLPVLSAAEEKPSLKITSVRVGFTGYDRSRSFHKSGMWAPVQVHVDVGDENIEGNMLLEINDNEDTPTVTTVPIQPLLLANEKNRALRSYVLPGNLSSDLKVKIKTRDRTFESDSVERSQIEPSAQIFLTLGARFADFHRSLHQLHLLDAKQGQLAGAGGKKPIPAPGVAKEDEDVQENLDTSPRFAAFETDANALPDKHQGYQAVDLIILSTENREFLHALKNDEAIRVKALGQWVRRGGHLVVSVHWKNQADVAELMNHRVWQPPIPVQLSAKRDPARDPKRLRSVEEWTLHTQQGDTHAFEMKDRIPVAQLFERLPGGREADWEVQAQFKERDGEPVPIIARMPYGLGSITFLAFSIDRGSAFSKWEGRFDFWKSLVQRLARRQVPGDAGQQFNKQGGQSIQDLVTKLHKELDTFDSKVIPFGWVAFIILIYILIVGPVDYLLLKYVFKRLEWTWITFPLVVVAVSLAAYFTAYGIKGKELRINQVDVVDIDMRTELNDKWEPTKAYVYGQTFFTLLSPRIQNYTIGLEPNARFWGQADANPPLSADMVAWLGKGGKEFGGAEARGAQSYFRRPYNIGDPSDQAVGLVGVPISVWASKAFTASWDSPLARLPLDVKLGYHQDFTRSDMVVSGKLTNNLPVDLLDMWLCYNNQFYGVADVIEKGKVVDVAVPLPQKSRTKSAHPWVVQEDVCDAARANSDTGLVYKPTSIIKDAFVFDKAQGQINDYNQWLRRLDQSWRMQEEVKKDSARPRDAFLYARVRYRSGSARDICADVDQPLPTRVWLGKLPGHRIAPGEKLSRPELSGNLNQDTYIRVLIGIRPGS